MFNNIMDLQREKSGGSNGLSQNLNHPDISGLSDLSGLQLNEAENQFLIIWRKHLSLAAPLSSDSVATM